MSINTFNRLIFFCLVSIVLLPSNYAIGKNKQSLSELLKTTIDQQGPVAAKNKFSQIYPKQKEDYSIDNRAMSQLISDYVQAGNMEAVQVLSEVMTTITQDMIAKHMTGQEETMKALMAEQKKQAYAKEHKSKTQPVEKTKQIVRTDLDRFTGLYGDPDKADPYRQLWVAQSCDGRLVIGATWGDVAPWWTTSQSDKQFSYKDSFIQLSFEFNETAQKQSTRLKHDLQGMASPLQRIGPLTDEYPTCFETPRR
jgi:hypothetical protein